MSRRALFLPILLLGLLLLSGCGDDDPTEGVAGFPPTPEAGEAAIEATNAIYEPAANSPDELGTPQASDEPLTRDESDADAPLANAQGAEEIFGIAIPLPDGAQLLEVDAPGDERYRKASYLVPTMSRDELTQFYLETMPPAGFVVEQADLGEGEAVETLRFTTEDVEKGGLISIVEAADGTRLTISTGSIDE